jgi:hypothetical protein
MLTAFKKTSWSSWLWQYGCFESFPFRQKLFIFVCQTMWFCWNVRHWTSGVNVHKKTSIDKCRFNVTQPNEYFYISVKDRYQSSYYPLANELGTYLVLKRLQCTDNYFFKIKFVLFLYLLLSASSVLIYFCYQTDWGTEH